MQKNNPKDVLITIMQIVFFFLKKMTKFFMVEPSIWRRENILNKVLKAQS